MATSNHLSFKREQPVNIKRSRPVNIPRKDINLPEHAIKLLSSLHIAKEKSSHEIGGYDERLLFKIEIDNFSGDGLNYIPGVEIVSQEEKGIFLVFSSEAGLEAFEARLSSLIVGETPVRQQLLEALESFDTFTEEDRKGWALKHYGFPNNEAFKLDIELWPLGDPEERIKLISTFEGWLEGEEITKLDSVKQESAIIYRVSVDSEKAHLLLNHRDVRSVDLPPQFQMDISLLHIDIQDIPETPAPDESAVSVTVLDSGIATNHPLLKSAIGDAQSFITEKGADDENGHGTFVAGKALYGDIEEKLDSGDFIPEFRLFSGRVLDENNESDINLIEHQVENSVRYFYENYGCKLFNFSYGDSNKPFLGGRIRGLAVTLDQLTRELNVLFVVPTGNFKGTEHIPTDWRNGYPEYLFSNEAKLLDPAPAINALTVGSIARYDRTHNSVRYANDPVEQPIATFKQPSPFTRTGPGLNGAIKPDLVAFGGNQAVNTRTNTLVDRSLGVVSFNRDFINGSLITEDIGTSFSCPYVTHLVARLSSIYPEASNNLNRAILASHAVQPLEMYELLDGDKDNLLAIAGYGEVDEEALFQSADDDLTLIAESLLPNKTHHFYEIPIPEQFWSGNKRKRQITISLAYSPSIRTTRIDYKTSRISFKLVKSEDLEKVSNYFNNEISIEDTVKKAEYSGNRNITETKRNKGTLQTSTWDFKQVNARERLKKWFVVVTRHDFPWAESITDENEAYSLVINLRDKESASSRLIEQVQTILRARDQVRMELRS